MARTDSSSSVAAGVVTLDSKLEGVVGGRTAAALQRAWNIRTVGELLSHYPRRYTTRGELTALDHLVSDESVTIVAEVRTVSERRMKQRRGTILDVVISDGVGMLTLTFFNQAWRKSELRPGARGVFAGKVSRYRDTLQLTHPDYELFDDLELQGDPEALEKWSRIPLPIYPATSSVPSWKVQSTIAIVLDALGDVPDPVPDSLRDSEELLPLRRALELVHRPESQRDWQRARDTLRFHEAFVLQAALLQQRAVVREKATRPREAVAAGALEQFDRALPFTLTPEQRVVGDEISADLARNVPMSRLLQGEVGSGKTLVALRAMLTVADTGGQAALLAPTEVLAAQHARSVVELLGPELSARLMPVVLTGSMSAADRKRALLRIVTGDARIVVGTHALLSDNVAFFDLGLVVIDEQHRFGVDQREALRLKAEHPPHTLVLTATPIPRTVAMTVFGDLDVSTIRNPPSGRAGIETFVVPLADKPGWQARVWQRANEELQQGRQVFVVCPAIDSTETTSDDEVDDSVTEADSDAGGDATSVTRPKASVESILALVRSHPDLRERRSEPLHGRMSGDDKDAVMRAFARGEVEILVATTVIEVGVDVPNASTMIVLDADRFGVSQLHQLRGRVGRGGVPGLCLLVTHAEQGSPARERVEAVAATSDGFELAQADLELRREGDVLGARQSGGRSSLRLLRVVRDSDVIERARAAAAQIIDTDPALAEHASLRGALDRRLDDDSRSYLVNA